MPTGVAGRGSSMEVKRLADPIASRADQGSRICRRAAAGGLCLTKPMQSRARAGKDVKLVAVLVVATGSR